MKKIILAAVLAAASLAVYAQGQGPDNPVIIPVSASPLGGACVQGLPNRQVVSSGTQYSCQHIVAGVGTWDVLPGGSGSGAVSDGAGTTTPGLVAQSTGSAHVQSYSAALANGTTATTQAQADGSTKVATTAYVDTGLSGKAASNASTTVDSQTCALGGSCTHTLAAFGAGAIANASTATTQAANSADNKVATDNTVINAFATPPTAGYGSTTPEPVAATSIIVPSDTIHSQAVTLISNGTVNQNAGAAQGWEAYVGAGATNGLRDIPQTLPAATSLLQCAAGASNHSVCSDVASPAGAIVGISNLGTVTWNNGGTCTFAAATAYIAGGTVTTVTGQSCTLSPTNLQIWGSYTLKVINGSGAAATLTLGTAGACTAWKVRGGGGGAITLSGASAIDVLTFTFDGTNCLAAFGTTFS